LKIVRISHGVAAGAVPQVIASGPLRLLKDVDFGGPLHSMVIVGDMHHIEEEMLRSFIYLEGGVTGFEKGADGKLLVQPKAAGVPQQEPAAAAAAPAEDEGGSGLLGIAAKVLAEPDADEKARLTAEARKMWLSGGLEVGVPPKGRLSLRPSPARPSKVQMVDSKKVTAKNRAAFIHSLVHAESYAIDLMWDMVVRFHGEGLPRDFYDDWCKVASEEAVHYCGWRDRLRSDFPLQARLPFFLCDDSIFRFEATACVRLSTLAS
jgi:hypothetical protein